jgi:hypothetical protein
MRQHDDHKQRGVAGLVSGVGLLLGSSLNFYLVDQI